MFKNIIKTLSSIENWWNKPQEKPLMPGYSFYFVRLSEHARMQGITEDEHNYLIDIYEGGEVKETYEYSKEMEEAIKETYEIPGVWEKQINKDIVFEDYADFGEI